jgi:ABC-2 type transport system ATP-binding protein
MTTASPGYRNSIGIVSQHTNLELDLTAFQNLKVHGLLYGMKGSGFRKKADELLFLAGLEEQRHTIVRTFSGGIKRRLQIVRALLHDPELLILDEPTVGLDPSSRESIWDIIIDLNISGKTILFSTHYMEEAQNHAKRVSIIHQGRIIADGTAESLIEEHGKWCRIMQRGKEKKTDFFPSREEALDRVKENRGDKDNGDSQMTIRRTSLEDVFITLTGKELQFHDHA